MQKLHKADTLVQPYRRNAMLSENSLPEKSIEDYKELFGFPIRSYYEKVGFDLEIIVDDVYGAA